MNLIDLLQIFSMAGEKLDALWNFFVTVHLAIYGALFVFHKMKPHQMWITVVSYVAFSAINFRAKYFEYRLYGALLDEIRRLDLNSKDLRHLSAFFSQYSIDDRVFIAASVHIIALVFLVFLLFKSRGPRGSTKPLDEASMLGKQRENQGQIPVSAPNEIAIMKRSWWQL